MLMALVSKQSCYRFDNIDLIELLQVVAQMRSTKMLLLHVCLSIQSVSIFGVFISNLSVSVI